jgi:hypothetical protein
MNITPLLAEPAITGGLIVLIYIACVIGVAIFVLRLLMRFVGAHERIAISLEIIARKLRDDGK